MPIPQTLDDHTELVLSYKDVGAQLQPMRFGELICPQGPSSTIDFFCGIDMRGGTRSTCGMASTGWLSMILRRMGLDGNLSDPITDDRWENRLVDRAHADDAYFTSGSGRPITRGCIVYMLNSMGQHWTTTTTDPDASGVTKCMAGGHVDETGHQIIREEERIFHGTAWEAHSGKPIVYFIDCGIIIAKACATLNLTHDPV